MEYKTPEGQRIKLKAKRDAIKEAGGLAYEELLVRERAARKLQRQRDPAKTRSDRRKYEKTGPGFHRRRLLMRARRRARDAGLEDSIRMPDVFWPTHCPVLGIELDYDTRCGQRKSLNPAAPSLDRWDNSKGYVPGNVFVISLRANQLKNNANADELDAIARYARRGLPAKISAGALPG